MCVSSTKLAQLRTPRVVHSTLECPPSRPHVLKLSTHFFSPVVRIGPVSEGYPLRAVKSADAGEQLDAESMQLISDLSSKADTFVKDASVRHTESAKLQTTEPVQSNELRKKVMKSILDLQSGLLERETEVRLLLLAALCGEHLLLLGPPGTAKSELSRRLSSLCGGRYFERLLTRFSVPEELFGPLSMKGKNEK